MGCAMPDSTEHRPGEGPVPGGEAALLLGAAFDCTAAAAAAAAHVFRPRSIARGATLFREGDACACCWLVIEGALALRSVGLEGQPIQLASYGPGEFVGAYPTARAQDGELAATLPTSALEAAAADLARLARTVPDLGAGLAALLARQHDKLIARMASQIALSAPGRVYAELIAISGADDSIRPAPVLAALAMRVNTTRETASRAVTAAERRGLLRREGGNLIIVSRDRLAALVY